MRQGDMVVTYVSTDTTRNFQASRSSMSIVAASATGPQGAQGVPGMPGTAADVGGYWSSRLVNGTAIATSRTVLPIDVASRADGFTLVSGAVRCDKPGRYLAQLFLARSSATTSALSWCQIEQWRSGVNILTWDTIGVGAALANSYNLLVSGGIFELQAGDLLYATSQGNVASGVSAQSNFMITPIGGAKGDPGMPGSAAGTTAWTALALDPAWSNYAGGAEFNPAMWRMAGDVVELRGLIQRSPTTLGTFTIATFPTAQRPPKRNLFAAPISTGMGRVDMQAVSGVLQTVGAQGTAGDYAFLSLDGIRWSTI